MLPLLLYGKLQKLSTYTYFEIFKELNSNVCLTSAEQSENFVLTTYPVL